MGMPTRLVSHLQTDAYVSSRCTGLHTRLSLHLFSCTRRPIYILTRAISIPRSGAHVVLMTAIVPAAGSCDGRWGFRYRMPQSSALYLSPTPRPPHVSAYTQFPKGRESSVRLARTHTTWVNPRTCLMLMPASKFAVLRATYCADSLY